MVASRKNQNPFPECVPQDILLRDQFHEFLRASFLDEIKTNESELAVKMRIVRETCRHGNPFPFIAYQWPELIVADPDEAAIFCANLDRIQEADITPRMRQVILDPGNPVLRLDWWQYIILAGMFDVSIGEIFIKGCTGAGKGAAVSIGVNVWFDVFSESRVHVTGRDFSHALKNIFGEVIKWRRRMTTPCDSRVLGQSVADTERHYITILNPDVSSPTAGEAFSGAHGENTLYGFDEATSAPDTFPLNARKNARMIIALANPRTMSGWFRSGFETMPDINKIGMTPGILRMRLCVTVGGPDCLNVANERLRNPVGPKGGVLVNGVEYREGQVIEGEENLKRIKPLVPQQIDLAQFRAIISSPDKRIEVPVFGYGKFPEEDPDIQVILSSWLPRHEEYWSAHNAEIDVSCFGLDVARSLAGDRTVLAAGGERGVRELHEFKINDMTEIANTVIQTAKTIYGIDLTLGQTPVCIDFGGGYGSGVGDFLRRQRVWVIEFQPGGGSCMPRNYANLRTEGYAELGRRFDPMGPFASQPWGIPPREGLRAELVAPEKKYGNDLIRFIIEPKEEIKRKLHGHSPDLADSITYLYYAVRLRFNYDQWLQRYTAPLLIYPEPSESNVKIQRKVASDVDKARATMERELSNTPYHSLQFDLFSAEDGGRAVDGGRAIEVAPVGNGDNNAGLDANTPAESSVIIRPNQTEPEVLQWLRQEYGVRPRGKQANGKENGQSVKNGSSNGVGAGGGEPAKSSPLSRINLDELFGDSE